MTRILPSRELPAAASASPRLREAMSAPIEDRIALLEAAPRDPTLWAAYAATIEADEAPRLQGLLKAYPVEIASDMVGGVPVHRITPRQPAPRHDAIHLLHLHGGAYVLGKGLSGVSEAVLVAHHTGLPVISVDYRLAPDHPFPAAVEDAVSVWRELTTTCDPASVGVFGTSAGGALTVSTALAARKLGLRLPGALWASTPWSDLTGSGDSCAVNRYVDNVVPQYEGLLEAAAHAYAGPDKLADPLASPLFADATGLPPTLLMAGTRDLFLSDTVRLHRRLRAYGVQAELHVFEGVSHGDLNAYHESGEALEAFGEARGFLERHLRTKAQLS